MGIYVRAITQLASIKYSFYEFVPLMLYILADKTINKNMCYVHYIVLLFIKKRRT